MAVAAQDITSRPPRSIPASISTREKPSLISIASMARPSDNGMQIRIERGARPIVVNQDDLKNALVSKRQPTHWGYDEFGQKTDLVGVPVLTNNWYESKKK